MRTKYLDKQFKVIKEFVKLTSVEEEIIKNALTLCYQEGRIVELKKRLKRLKKS